MIHAENLRLQYPTKTDPALDGVSFEAAEGEVLGVVGPTESGKTSLAQAIAGFAPSVTGGTLDGELEVAGCDPREVDDATRVGMVFEDYSSQLTQVHVLDEIIVPLLSQGYDRETAREKAHNLLERVRLDGYGDKRTWELSGGEQQRVAIAAVLALDPEVLVFDTATDMLDPDGREDVWNLITSLKGETTLVVTVADPQDLVGVADRVLVIKNGTTTAFGGLDETIRDHDLLEGVGVTPPICLRVAEKLGISANPLTPGEFANIPGIENSKRTHTTETATVAPDGGTVADTASEPVLDIEDVTFGYSDDETAIENIDLDIHEGEVHALIGGNGAGKSTLSELLVGLLRPDEGRIRVDGEITTDATVAGIGESVALSFQNPDEQLSKRTVEKEIRFPLDERQYERTGWFSKRERYDDDYIDERVETACELTGLDDQTRDEDPTFLPQGERRLAVTASALAPDPSLAILDEPTAGLDADGTDRIRRTIDHLRSDGKAVLLIAHDMDFVCEVADRVTLLGDGETILHGTPDEVFAHENWETLHDQYVRPPRAARLADRLGVEARTVDELVDRLQPLAEVNR
jgi:energy-coupling factor transporter ATP-binding protein EcfA2